jgi:CheY-like chemotaxis protein
MVIAALLEKAGHTVHWYLNGLQAWEHLQRGPAEVDLVITDQNLAGLSGRDFTVRARALPYGGRILVLSGYLEDGMAESLRRAGADLVLGKPIGLAELLAAVERLASAAE